MNRCIVNVATGRYVIGQNRLRNAFHEDVVAWTDSLPIGCPVHNDVPYAFKAWAIRAARDVGYDLVLWADSCILPNGSLEPLWDRIADKKY